MLEPDQWDAVLGRITGTVYRGTERISSNALLNLLEVGPDPVIRQKVGKRVKCTEPVGRPVFFPELVARGAGSCILLTCPSRRSMSAFGGKADIVQRKRDVCY